MAENNTQLMATTAQRFVSKVQELFVAEMGDALHFTDYEKTLAQHLFAHVDNALKAYEDKRDPQKNPVPFKWENVNMPKLALDAVHRINLGLDALIPNHIHPIPYLNSKTKKYDIDLRIGYKGKDYCRRKLAVEEPVDVIYQLVHETDKFKPIMKSGTNDIESFEFEITNPFDRGKVIGGFGYIMFKDPRKNKLIIVTPRDFEKAKAASKSDKFWGDKNWEKEMQYKTIVHRVAEHLPLDPKKVNAKSYAYIEEQEKEAMVQREIDENANKETIDIQFSVTDDMPEQSGEDKQVAEKKQPLTQDESGQMSFAATGTEGPGF